MATAILERGPTGVESGGNSDFRLEYGKNTSDKALFNEIVSYLAEYRFSLPKFPYVLKYSGGKLKDPHSGNPMQDSTQKSIDKRISDGRESSREIAEKQGFINLDKQLMFVRNNDTVVWASPPGLKEDGYGNYGFIFIGNVQIDNLSEKTVRMTAIRLENPKIEQFNQIIHFLTGEETDYKRAEEFIANPRITKEHLPEDYVDALLRRAFSFKPNEREQRIFWDIIQDVSPFIREVMQTLKDPSKARAEKRRTFNALENYVLQLKEKYNQPLITAGGIIADFTIKPKWGEVVKGFGFEPPKVAGSCPANNNKNSLTSSNLFSKALILNDLFENQEWFHCPRCDYQADGPIGDTCPGCGLTKQAYARQTGISCN